MIQPNIYVEATAEDITEQYLAHNHWFFKVVGTVAVEGGISLNGEPVLLLNLKDQVNGRTKSFIIRVMPIAGQIIKDLQQPVKEDIGLKSY